MVRFLSSFNSLHNICRFYGLLPLNNNFQLSKLFLTVTLLDRLLEMIVSILFIYLRTSTAQPHGLEFIAKEFTLYARVIFILPANFLHIYSLLKNRKYLQKIQEHIGHNVDVSKVKLFIYLWLLLVGIKVSAVFYTKFGYLSKFVRRVIYTYYDISLMLLIAQFFIQVERLTILLTRLDQQLKSIILFDSRINIKKLFSLTIKHQKLIYFAYLIDSIYSKVLLFICTYCFITFVMVTYNLICTFHGVDITFLVQKSVSIIMVLLAIVSAAHFCEMFVKKVSY